jgi:hypothetical protein
MQAQALRWLSLVLAVAGWAVVRALWGDTVALGAFLFLCGILVGYAWRHVEARLERSAVASTKGGI